MIDKGWWVVLIVSIVFMGGFLIIYKEDKQEKEQCQTLTCADGSIPRVVSQVGCSCISNPMKP